MCRGNGGRTGFERMQKIVAVARLRIGKRNFQNRQCLRTQRHGHCQHCNDHHDSNSIQLSSRGCLAWGVHDVAPFFGFSMNASLANSIPAKCLFHVTFEAFEELRYPAIKRG